MAKVYKLEGIDLKNGANKVTMVCHPDGYKAAETVNVIVFLHGLSQTSAELYLTQTDHKLQEKLDISGVPQQFLLIVPPLPSEARGGKLGAPASDPAPPTKDEGLQWFLPGVSPALQQKNPPPPIAVFDSPAKVGQVVLAAHSG